MSEWSAREGVGRLAAKQHGRVSWAQLRHLDVPQSTIHEWAARSYLTRVLPKVYAIGHTAPSREADLWAAVLYAGPGAMLSHATAARWRGLIDYAPRIIEVSTPRRVRSLPGVKVYARRHGLDRPIHAGIPVTPVPQMMLDVAATCDLKLLNRALSQLDHQHRLNIAALERACGPGYPGATILREALATYNPRMKYANGGLEEAFVSFCDKRRLPMPRLNVYVHGIKSDAYWPEARLVVELDSEDNHSTPWQRRRDRRNDLTLRSHGLTVLRYDWVLVHEQAEEVTQDVLGALERGLSVRWPAGH